LVAGSIPYTVHHFTPYFRIVAIRTFVRAFETGSFTAVALELGTSQPTISKRIAWLESQLGANLLERSTRELILTFVQDGLLTGPAGAPFGSAGFSINCPIVLRLD
jgi:hypothetical protein